jgi:hypothetical protein
MGGRKFRKSLLQAQCLSIKLQVTVKSCCGQPTNLAIQFPIVIPSIFNTLFVALSTFLWSAYYNSPVHILAVRLLQ